jgi:type I restriction enzyme S subunit
MKLVDTTLANILDFYNGKVTKSSEQGNVPIYGSNGIIGLTNRKLYKDAIILGRVGAYCGSVMRCKDEFWASDNTIVVKPKQDIANINYCYYLLKNLNLNNYAGGAAQPLITQTTLKQIKIKIPNIDEQKRIANILSAYDDLIENNQKQIKLLEEAAMRLYKEWFVNLRFPGYENTKIVDGVPEGWEYKEVGSLISKTPRTKQVKKSEYNNSGEIPIIDQSREFIAGYTDDRETIVDLGVPVIVFGDHTRILKLINFPFAKGADGTQLIVSGVEEMPQHLLYCSLLNIDLSNYHYARHFKYLKASKIIVPTKNISEEFESIVEIYFKVIQILIDKIFLLQKSRDFLLPKLMNGEIEV